MRKKIITKSFKETQNLGKELASLINPSSEAVVLLLHGNLGSGKTTFLQGFAKGLGIKEKILSPTFVIQKRFLLKNKKFHNFYHIDCYRLKNEKPARAGGDILELGFKDIIKNPENIIAIEWPEKIKKVLPKNCIKINFKFINENERAIDIEI